MEFTSLDHFTMSLVTLTIIGGPITYFVQTEYARKYRYWIKNYLLPKSKKYIKLALRIVEKLPEDKKKLLLDIATKQAVALSNKEAFVKIKTTLNVDDDAVKAIVKTGAKKIKEIIEKV